MDSEEKRSQLSVFRGVSWPRRAPRSADNLRFSMLQCHRVDGHESLRIRNNAQQRGERVRVNTARRPPLSDV
jgi:hypothetical protein